MAKKLMTVNVPSNGRPYLIEFWGDERYVQEWRDAGLEIDIIQNQIPVWVVRIGAARQWCFLQDIFNFKNPFGK